MKLDEILQQAMRDGGGVELEPDVLESVAQAVRAWAAATVSVHTEHEGGYCDTGEDMDWACRSECIDLALKRIQESR